ncbi:zinc/manganese ABC transporter substrate-binding protein [Bifidobacterium bohemicum DSM 22767]|uniref:Zinc/manganese ABC transporter substrate-binding protein n=1 Tax=Bifidobacterium bohemicum DSM 22767 TaxID=1437606 RepID=A0A086ZJZ0_9BIFI|nr:zinc ABC transporter substrate-binding protein [Bifidobacterium bohemicum]KFI46840.1 zinc/manganese ABC transporter substrate-binding protein [Bifidobacterium bohemicum DSM 22767]
MKRHGLRIAAVTAAACLALTAGACGRKEPGPTPQPQAQEPAAPIMVTASINQWGSLAKQIGGQDVTVRSILDSTSIKTHDFTPQNADTTKLTGAEIVVANGAGYDSWATGKLGKNAVTVSASTTVGATNGDNPHLWFSKDARSAMATELENAFAKARPSESATLRREAQGLENR